MKAKAYTKAQKAKEKLRIMRRNLSCPIVEKRDGMPQMHVQAATRSGYNMSTTYNSAINPTQRQVNTIPYLSAVNSEGLHYNNASDGYSNYSYGSSSGAPVAICKGKASINYSGSVVNQQVSTCQYPSRSAQHTTNNDPTALLIAFTQDLAPLIFD